MKGSNSREVCCEKFLVGSNHNSLEVKIEHPHVYKVIIEPDGCDQAQEVKSPFPCLQARLVQSQTDGSFLILLIGDYYYYY